MNNIVEEANEYVREPRKLLDTTMDGPNWEDLIVLGLKAFLVVSIFMDIKKQPNYKTYNTRTSYSIALGSAIYIYESPFCGVAIVSSCNK